MIVARSHRRAIGRAALALAVLAWGGLPAAHAQTLDLTVPADALKATRKIHCSTTDGEPVTMTWRGRAYSRVPGERDRLLFNVLGMNVRACHAVKSPAGHDGYRMVSREIMLYLDPVTNDVLRTWKNPWTGKEVEVVHVANDPVNGRPTYVKDADGRDYVFPGIVEGGQVIQALEVPLFYTNPLAGDYQQYVGGTYQAMESFQFFMDEADLRDATKPRVERLGVGWVRVAQWLPWMEMGSLTGQMIGTAPGRSLRAWDDLPAVMKAEIEKHYPAYKTAPPADDARPNETSWTYFKKVIDAKRAAKKP